MQAPRGDFRGRSSWCPVAYVRKATILYSGGEREGSRKKVRHSFRAAQNRRSPGTVLPLLDPTPRGERGQEEGSVLGLRGNHRGGLPSRASGRAGQLRLDGDGQGRLLNPATGVRGALPALQGDGADVSAFLVVEEVEVGLGEVATHLGGRAADVDQTVGSVVEDRDGPPSLRFCFGVIEHGLTLL